MKIIIGGLIMAAIMATTVHAFTNPDADKAGIKGVAYNETADRRSWQAMSLFLDEIFR